MLPNFVKVGVIAQAAEGVIPASSRQLVNVRSVQLRQERDAQRPSVLSGDRRPYPTRILRKSGAIVLPTYGQYENDLLLMEALFNEARGSAVSIGPAVTLSVTGTNSLEDSGNGLGDLAVGDLFYMSGWAGGNVGNNGWKGPILTAAAGAVTVPTGQLTNTAAGDSVTIQTRRLLDGVTDKYLAVEWEDTAVANQFRRSTDNRVVSMRENFEQGSWVMREWNLMGRVPGMESATMGTGADTAAPDTGFLTAVDDYGTLNWGGGSISASLITTSLTLDIANVVQPIYGLGDVGPSTFAIGSVAASIDGRAIFNAAGRTLQDAIEAHSSLWIWWDWVDPQGNREAVILYAVKPDTGDVEIGEADSAPLSIPFRLTGHDPSKDASSPLNGIGLSAVVGRFWVPAA